MRVVHAAVVRALRAVGLYRLARSAYDSYAHRLPGRRDRLSELYGRFVERGDLCFDIGANVGNRIGIFLALGARVVAVEPQERCFDVLQRRYGANADVSLVQTAVGAEAGAAEMFLSDAHTISSLSSDWIREVRASGRFGAHTWDSEVTVPLTTLDALIATYGEPAFCKIDVEGYEADVLAGLSRPLRCVSFEYTPELAGAGVECLRRLDELAPTQFNVSLGETGRLELARWVDAAELERRLGTLAGVGAFADVYARTVTRDATERR
jgi:FkbM family methyltransferase